MFGIKVDELLRLDSSHFKEFVLFAGYYDSHKVKEGEMAGACSKQV
jgi:hypothetical protein